MRMWAFIICECGISVGILGCVHDNRLAFYTPEMIPIVRRIFQIPFIKLSSIEHFYEKNVNMYVRSHALNCQIEIQIHDLFCMFTQIHPKINTKRQKMMTEKMNKTQSRIDGCFFSTPHLLRRPRFVYKIFSHEKMEKFDAMGKSVWKWEVRKSLYWLKPLMSIPFFGASNFDHQKETTFMGLCIG